jgi:hypothetical protein
VHFLVMDAASTRFHGSAARPIGRATMTPRPPGTREVQGRARFRGPFCPGVELAHQAFDQGYGARASIRMDKFLSCKPPPTVMRLSSPTRR